LEASMAVVSGLTERRLARIGSRLEVFAGDVFEGAFVRSEQRRWARVYLRGLMLDGKRKSIEPMAARLQDGDEQCLQQFVNQSPWDEAIVRANLAQRMVGELAPEAWAIDDTGFAKKGRWSVGVARQYSGTLGRVDNCQVVVSVNAVTDHASCPLDWRVFLPPAWDQDAERRAKAHVPDEVRHREKWRLALDMIDELAGLGLAPPLLCADAGYGESTAFRQGLSDRGIPYVVQVKQGTSAFGEDVEREQADYQGRGRPPVRRYHDKPSSLKDLVLAVGPDAAHQITWREGSRGAMHSRFLALRVRPANRELLGAAHKADRDLEVCWLLAEWPPDSEVPTDYWLATLPADTRLPELVRLAKLRWRIEHDYRELKHGLGLDHFEGRSYRGLNHHLTLVSVAHAFLTLERQRPRTRAAA
jgi:SRSO17 transposase